LQDCNRRSIGSETAFCAKSAESLRERLRLIPGHRTLLLESGISKGERM